MLKTYELFTDAGISAKQLDMHPYIPIEKAFSGKTARLFGKMLLGKPILGKAVVSL